MIKRNIFNPYFWGIAAVFIGLIAVSGVVGFHYPVVIENEPLHHPVAIQEISEDLLFLDDGSVLRLEGTPDGESWDAVFQQSDYQVEINSSDSEPVAIYARQDGWICGTPWTQFIRIPLIPERVFKNRREIVGFAYVQKSAEQGAAANP